MAVERLRRGGRGVLSGGRGEGGGGDMAWIRDLGGWWGEGGIEWMGDGGE